MTSRAHLPPSPRLDGPDVDLEFLNHLERHGIPLNGLGVDLVAVANRAFRMRTYEEVKSERQDESSGPHLYCREMVALARRTRQEVGKGGMGCEHPQCRVMNMPLGLTLLQSQPLRRCGKCLQVNYCDAECQKSDWARHKQYCTAAQPGNTLNGGVLTIARHLLACVPLVNFMKAFAALVLDSANNKHAGHQHELVITCTSIPDTVAGTGRIFQLSRVVLNLNPVPYQLLEAVMAGQGVESLPSCRLIFKSDAPGVEGYLLSVHVMKPTLFPIARVHLDDPIAWMLLVNKEIREDVDNVYKFRMPG